jgi:hypothetical protein
MTINSEIWTPATGGYDTIVRGVLANEPKRGMELVNLRELGILPGVRGGAQRRGAHVAADVVTRTADGTDLNSVWNDFMALLNAANQPRQNLVNFLTFGVTQPIEQVTQVGDGVEFEEATEFGEPMGARIAPTYFNMGYGFKWWDLAARYTWQYLADATEAMVNSVANAAVEAYYRKLLFEVLKTVFNPTNLQAQINQQPYNVYKFYNNDGTVPPSYKNNTFVGSHTHYKQSGANNVLEATDVDTMIVDDFTSHGYSAENGYQIVLMASTTVGNQIRNFRSAVNTNQSVGGNYGRYDFVPAQGQPGQLIGLNQQLIGQTQVAPTLGGLTVIGTYGPLTIVQDDWLPNTHVLAFATGGPDNLLNPVGIREHAQTGLRGLRLVKGRNPDYPLIDSFWAVGFGTGVRHRGGGIVLELSASGTYAPPAIYA